VDALLAVQQLVSNRYVTHVAIMQDGAGDRDGSLGVISGLADAPFALRVADIPRNRRSRLALEPADARGIPSPDGVHGQAFGLLADGVTDGYALQTRHDSARGRVHVPPIRCLVSRFTVSGAIQG
jgi:hypothetical protein